MAERQLIELFHSCDKKGTGRIGPEEFRNLCAEFDIDPADSDAIFADLDHDGDGQVSLDDFAWGFRDFLNPDSFVTCTEDKKWPMDKQQLLDRRKSDARLAWSHLIEGIGEPAVFKFLNTSAKKLAQLYNDLQTSGSSPQLLTKFDGALCSLLQDVKRLYDDNQKLELMFNKEREVHLQRLRGLEEEMDAQVAKVEAEAKEEAKRSFEQEKKEIMEKMESEMAELQTHLHMFQKVNSVLTQKREDTHALKQDAALETRELRSNLSDTRTNLALLHSEMAKIKAEYESKCRELSSHQETVIQYMDQNKNIHRQLQLLQQANRNLQDTNDGLLTIIESSGGRVTPYCCSRTGSENGSSGRNTPSIRRKFPHTSRYQSIENVNTEHVLPPGDQELLHDPINGPFAIQRFMMEDIGDSGRSTLRDTIECDSDHKSLHEEFFNLSDAESALKSLESDGSKYSYPTLRQNADHKVESKSNAASISQYHDATGDPDRNEKIVIAATFKVVFAGDAAVGKSCFIHRFCKGIFANKLGSTLGVDFQIKTIKVDDEKNVVALQLWDTAGQERFRSMTKTYFRRADGVILLYDVTNERTFVNVRQWVHSISEVTDKEIPILICGNKVDLRDEQDLTINCVGTVHGEELAQTYNALFYETSSKTGKNIANAMLAITREMLLKEDVEVQTSALKITEMNRRSKLCCGKN